MAPLLKLCGNHSEGDIEVVFHSSADYVGFVFAKSKRKVERNQVIEWLEKQGPKGNKKLVALFVNAATKDIVQAIEGIPFDIIQCHGNESAEQVAEVKDKTGLDVWKVIHHNEDALSLMKTYKGIADGYIVDCKVGNQWGGTGVSFDWKYTPSYINEGRVQQVPVFIAGGIKPMNIDELLRYQPDGIDVSSGIEENGKKSSKLIRQLEERMNRNGSDVSR
ncbi:phosphoribosylanthranilate isomerase [Halalkalibacter nanhaiisediminis]|uniref:N-(5'-phosphoribosyl)anthranilate isomerase n=1 Tax=Halalkalibacter nanhaiisediminis TaxID=688079 RepID=A0A562QQB1_9BACI|nr:phosphoribosylanthranilate isomerase [Halalkalibacter nanhaiisediminis]TWI58863.1 phosphoribosylanthranilate isomerase [Halalkalibacter nanhaiisediminis]